MYNTHMKQTITSSSIALLVLLQFNTVSANANSCNDVTGYELYKCRVEILCGEQSGRKPSNFIYDTSSEENSYQELEAWDPTFLSLNQQKYRNNMNNLYKCALIQVQINSLNTVKALEKDSDIASRIDTKINNQIESLVKTQASLCTNIDDISLYNKTAVLQQSTYEVCRYINYLDYLDYYTDTIWNTLSSDENITTISLTSNQVSIKNDIQNELDHTLKVFPLAYTAYSQYENNVTIHLVLELIREDFIILRSRLHSVLWPISQLVYKISNSMTRGN